MAQDVEKHHPEAVGVMGGYKTVDYKKATQDAERPARAMGGLIPDSQGGRVWDGGLMPRKGYYGGGLIDKYDWQGILEAQKAATGPFGAKGFAGTPGTSSYVPAASLHVPSLVTAKPASQQPSGLSQAISTGSSLANFGKTAKDLYDKLNPKPSTATTTTPKAEAAVKDSTGTTGGNAADKPKVTSELEPENTGVMPSDQPNVQRSEEHTSELQSH